MPHGWNQTFHKYQIGGDPIVPYGCFRREPMHMDDMRAPQRALTAKMAGCCAAGAVLAPTHHQVWLLGVLGFVLIAVSAGRLRETQPGFDRVQQFAGLCALCKLVTMAFSGMTAARLGTALLPVFFLLLIYALWQAFGRMGAEGNGVGRAALTSGILCAALTLAENALALGNGLTAALDETVQWMTLGFEGLAALLLAAFLLMKRWRLKEETK